MIPPGPHAARHYGVGCKGYEFFSAEMRLDNIPLRGGCFCGASRPDLYISSAGGGFAFCPCGITWCSSQGKTGWVNPAVHTARPEGVVA